MNTNLSLVSEIIDTSFETSLIGRVSATKKYRLEFSVDGSCEMKLELKDLIKNKTYQMITKNNKYISRAYQFTFLPHKDSELIFNLSSINGRLYNIALYDLDSEVTE